MNILADMTASDIVSQIVEILVSGLTKFGQGLGKGISDIVTAMMFTTNGESQALSPFFVAVCIFAAVALAVGLTTLLFNFLRNLGK